MALVTVAMTCPALLAPTATGFDVPKQAIPDWSATLAFERTAPRIDGLCGLAEYWPNTIVSLEPNHAVSVRMLVTPGSLYLCTQPQIGATADDKIVLALSYASRAIHVSIAANGEVRTAKRDGSGPFHDAAIAGVRGEVTRWARYGFQDDIEHIDAPAWSGELRVPLRELGVVARPGTPLQLGVRLRRKRLPGELPSFLARSAISRGNWPWGFDRSKPTTYGHVRVGQSTAQRPVPADDLEPFTPHRLVQRVDYDAACPSYAFGAWISQPNFKWPLLAPLRRFDGTLLEMPDGMKVSHEDSVMLHRSHDLDMKAEAGTTNSRLLAIGGDGSRQVLETEEAGIPAGAWPWPGSHVTALGRWVFDCGHAPKTELHPVYALESDRESYRVIRSGQALRPVRIARVWMNPRNASPFYSVRPHPFEFSVALPDAIAPTRMPFARVATGDPAAVSVVAIKRGRVYFRIEPPREGTSLHKLVVGYLDSTEAFDAKSHVWDVEPYYMVIKDDLDGETKGAGEWHLWMGANGVWAQLLHEAPVDSGKVAEFDGAFEGVPEEFMEIKGRDYDGVRVSVFGYENDDTSTNIGGVGDPIGYRGRIVYKRGLHYIENRLYRLAFWLRKRTPRQALGTPAFWRPRLAEEPNDGAEQATSLGLATFAPGSGARTITHAARITERGARLDRGKVLLMAPDVDRYALKSNEFVHVAFGPLPAGIKKTFTRTYGSYSFDLFDACEQRQLGWQGVRVAVRSTTGLAGDKPYALTVRLTPREMPPDWGEPLDSNPGPSGDKCTPTVGTPGSGGRPVNLTARALQGRSVRMLTKGFAWQHTRGDVDDYRVVVPESTPPPSDEPACSLDEKPKLTLLAPDMRMLAVGRTSAGRYLVNRTDSITITGPVAGPMRAAVSHPLLGRAAYRFKAIWRDRVHYDPARCASLLEAFRDCRRPGSHQVCPILPAPAALRRRQPLPGLLFRTGR